MNRLHFERHDRLQRGEPKDGLELAFAKEQVSEYDKIFISYSVLFIRYWFIFLILTSSVVAGIAAVVDSRQGNDCSKSGY